MSDSASPERDFLQALGNELRSWRNARGLTRQELAARAGISHSTLGRIERASGAAATVADVWRLADELGLTFSDLVLRTEEAARLASTANTAKIVTAKFGKGRGASGLPFAADAAAHRMEASILDEQEQQGD